MTSKPLLIILFSFSSVLVWFEKYVYADWEFLLYLFIAVIVDTGIGMYRYWEQGSLSKSGSKKFLRKIVVYSSVLIIMHTLSSFTIEGEGFTVHDYLRIAAYTGLIYAELRSMLGHVRALYPNILPKSILKRIND